MYRADQNGKSVTETLPQDFPEIPNKLKTKMYIWTFHFNDRYSWDLGWPSSDDFEFHQRIAFELKTELQTSLGSGYRVFLNLWAKKIKA